MPVLDVKNITKKFGSFTALDGVSVSLEAGETLAVIGT